ncbi:MAG: hypothetical protein ACRENT_01615 [Thermodesulfobacteriota bacterium]
MSKIVILEGPDATGKTTFAELLVQQGYIYHHEGVPPKNINLVEYYRRQLLDAKRSLQNHVFDRHFLGQLVYGPVFRGCCVNVDDLLRICLEWDVQLILFNTSWKSQLKIWSNRQEQEGIKNLDLLKECYDRWIALQKAYPYLPVFDYTKDSTLDLLLSCQRGENVS